MVFPIVGGNQSTGDFITNSLRFNDDDGSNISRALSSPNTDKFTVSFWVKISGARANIFSIGQRLTGETGDYYALSVDLGTGTGSGRLSLGGYNGVADSNTIAVNTGEATGPVFRDPNAWQHHVYAFDTGQASAGNRFKWYVNGVLQSEYNTTTTPSQNVDLFSSSGTSFRIGQMYSDESRYMDGYLSEFYYVDGQQYDQTYFGEFNDNGVWVPVENGKGAGGTINFGTNGFYLQFKQTGSSANASGFGADTSGNDNHLGVGGIGTDHVTTDTPQNNFCTLNPLYTQGSPTFSEGNCKVVLAAGDGNQGAAGSIAPANGKWYWEVKQGSATNSAILVREASDDEDNLSYYQGNFAGYTFNNGNQNITGNTNSTYGPSYSAGDIIMVAMDMDNDRVFFGKNGSWIDGEGNADEANLSDHVPLNGVINGLAAVANANSGATATFEMNFGNPPYSISSGNSDANGHGNFEYAVPSGYFALCTKNLAEHG